MPFLPEIAARVRCSARLPVLAALLSAYEVPLAAAFPSEQPRAGLTLLALGDWGGVDSKNPTSEAQVSAAHGMNKVSSQIGAEGVLLLGDNFYDQGVDSNMSLRFQQTFADVYLTKEYLVNLTFHVTLGNHDYYSGNPKAQLSYRGHPQWSFPSVFYTLQKSWLRRDGRTGTVDFIFIDTCQLVPSVTFSWQYRHHQKTTVGHWNLNKEEMWRWTLRKIESSTADFLFVVGHYPIYTVGGHGPTKALVQRLLPQLKKHGGHYIAGHDHTVGHYSDSGVQMMVSGAGMECCKKKTSSLPKENVHFYITGKEGSGPGDGPRQSQVPVRGAFGALHLFDDFAKFSFYDQDGNTLYESEQFPKRTEAKRQLGDVVV